jgi:hypothetical protein
MFTPPPHLPVAKLHMGKELYSRRSRALQILTLLYNNSRRNAHSEQYLERYNMAPRWLLHYAIEDY